MALIQRIRLSFVALIFFRIIPVYSDQACTLCDEHETLNSLRPIGGGETCRSLNDDLSLIPSDSADCQRYNTIQWFCCTSNAPPSPSPTASPQNADEEDEEDSDYEDDKEDEEDSDNEPDDQQALGPEQGGATQKSTLRLAIFI